MRFKYHKQFRLPYFNYASSNSYFVTICSAHRQPLFGVLRDGKVELSVIGGFVERSWMMIPVVSPFASLDVFVIMPDHMHGIIVLNNPDEPTTVDVVRSIVRPHSLSSIIRDFKSAVTTRSRKHFGEPGLEIWQHRFHDRIIRNERELHAIRRYIVENPIH